MEPRLVLVDFDDTLVDTGPQFSRRRAALFDALVSEGFERSEVERVHHQVVEMELIPLMGFGPFRLAPSFRDTYLRLSAETGREVDPSTCRRMESLADGIEGPPPLLPGAIQALRRLAAAFPTILYTQSGFPDYQLSCVRAAGVEAVLGLPRIRITPRKTREAFERTARDFGVVRLHDALMVGNSVRSDVNPALEAGARAIWIQGGETWHHDMADPLDPEVPRAPSFAHAVTSLLQSM